MLPITFLSLASKSLDNNLCKLPTSSAYLIDSYDIWHSRLRHVNSSCINIMQSLDMITVNNKKSGKFDIYLESKLTKEKCMYV